MKKYFKKTLFLASLITSISSLSAMAMPSRNDLGQINNVFNNNINNQLNEEEKVEKFNNIIREYRDNNYEQNNYYDDEFVFSDYYRGMSTFKEFVGNQLIIGRSVSPSFYDNKIKLIRALETRNIESVLEIMREILRDILNNHIALQCNNLRDNELTYIDEQIEIIDGTEESVISNFMNTLVDSFKITTNYRKFNIEIDEFDYTRRMNVYNQNPRNITLKRMFSIYMRFARYMQKILDEYLNK